MKNEDYMTAKLSLLTNIDRSLNRIADALDVAVFTASPVDVANKIADMCRTAQDTLAETPQHPAMEILGEIHDTALGLIHKPDDMPTDAESSGDEPAGRSAEG